MADTADLERRVTALETAQNEATQTLRWVVAKLGRVSAVQDEQSLRLERLETRLERMETKVVTLSGALDGLRRDLPVMIADAMREVLRERRDW